MQSGSPFEVNVPHFNLGDFSDLSSIAIGGEGEVSRGTNSNLGNVAVKALFRPVKIEDLKELKILVEAKHPHIVQLFGILVSDGDLTICRGYVMELMEFGSLNSVIHNPSKHYDMRQVYSWIEQAGHGLKYLHYRSIIHRDIKPNKFVDSCSSILFSMLLVSMDHLKIADFGLAREIVIDGSITGGIGTCFYMAPEIIQSHPYGPAADVYAFIISIWEIVYRRMPYDLERISIVTFSTEVIKNGRRPIIEEGFEVDAEMRELLQRGWDADPAKRITIDEIINYAKQKISQEDGKTILPFSREKSNTKQILTITAKLKEMENQAMVMSLEISASKKFEERAMEQQEKMEKALEDQRRIHEKDRKKTEEAFDELRKLNEKLSARLDWLEDKRTILMLRGRGDTKKLLILDRETLQWKTSPVELPEAGYGCGMICLEQEIYIFGGGSLWDKTYKLNKEMKWDRMADMNEGRDNIMNSFLLFDGCIWLFGGLNQSEEDLNTVEKYNPSENKWIKKPSMKEKRKGAAAAVCGGKIYVCGGVIDTGGCFEALKSVECFDPKEEVWTKFVDLTIPNGGIGVISDGGCLIIIGGSGGTSFKNVWKINPNDANPKWKELPSMKETRYYLTVQSIGKKILAIGGRHNKSVEIFDGKSWESGTELPEICWGVPSAVIPHSLAARLLPM